MRRPRPIVPLAAAILVLQAPVPSPAAAEEAGVAVACGPPIAQILSPSDGAQVPRAGLDPPCDRDGYCIAITVQGRIGNCYWPFIGVTPRETKPLFWIQPRIQHVDRTTGHFSLEVRLGSGRDGLDEEFEILVIGHRQQNRFYDDETLFGLPEECQKAGAGSAAASCIASEVVTVRRVR
jgi:hypothetical protein